MESKFLITLLTIILPLIGASIGYLYKQGIEKKKELLGEVHRERRELYQQFVNLIIGLYGDIKLDRPHDNNEMLAKHFEFYKKYVLYASPEVINAFSNYFQFLYSINGNTQKPDAKDQIRKLTKVMIMMRKDLGLSNKGLGEDGEKLFRALITDFDTAMLADSHIA
jgi:hypothetical protein